MNMKANPITLIRRGAEALRANGETSSAYGLHEIANHLLLLMDGKVSLDDWHQAYTAQNSEALDLDKHMPVDDGGGDGRE